MIDPDIGRSFGAKAGDTSCLIYFAAGLKETAAPPPEASISRSDESESTFFFSIR